MALASWQGPLHRRGGRRQRGPVLGPSARPDVQRRGRERLAGRADQQHRIWINEVPEPHTVKNRVHLDVHTGSLADLEALGRAAARDVPALDHHGRPGRPGVLRASSGTTPPDSGCTSWSSTAPMRRRWRAGGAGCFGVAGRARRRGLLGRGHAGAAVRRAGLRQRARAQDGQEPGALGCRGGDRTSWSRPAPPCCGPRAATSAGTCWPTRTATSSAPSTDRRGRWTRRRLDRSPAGRRRAGYRACRVHRPARRRRRLAQPARRRADRLAAGPAHASRGGLRRAPHHRADRDRADQSFGLAPRRLSIGTGCWSTSAAGPRTPSSRCGPTSTRCRCPITSRSVRLAEPGRAATPAATTRTPRSCSAVAGCLAGVAEICPARSG